MPRNGNTTARGYGNRHQQDRARWVPAVAAGAVPCRRCGYLIQPGQSWDLGHDDWDRTAPSAPEHRHRSGGCIGNRAAGTRKANQIRRASRTRRQPVVASQPQPVTSRQWWAPPAQR